MDIGIGLPVVRPDPALSITAWARRAEEHGFTSLGAIDRLIYDNYEPFTALAVAAGATSRIQLTTVILLAPLRANDALFVKSAATLDRLSGGRLVLGLAPGGREDDYTAGGLDFRHRGELLDVLVEQAARQWDRPGDGVGPAPITTACGRSEATSARKATFEKRLKGTSSGRRPESGVSGSEGTGIISLIPSAPRTGA